MLAPHAAVIAAIISSLIASLCFTFAEPFDDIFLFVKSSYALVSGNTNKSIRPKQGRKDWPTDRSTKRVNSRSLTKLLFRILQNSRKKIFQNEKHHSTEFWKTFQTSRNFSCHILFNMKVRWKIGPRGALPYMGYIGMCGPKGYGFLAVLVINRVLIFAL